ncbi:MAG: protein tyrosine phosphatase [Phenylobacterium zucineum]|nr:MAG: protein tyrosine phosphatase [Phenylobacterium zucineum]
MVPALETIENFRDFGGYDTACGRGLKRGLLYRSANHAYASEDDIEVLGTLGVKAIVDLRRPMERQREPSKRWTGFDAHVVENDHEPEGSDWAHLMAASHQVDADWFREDSLSFYRATPYDPRYVDLFSLYFQVLAESSGAILVHCSAGKDRTGMICALTHHLVGVHPDDIRADFLATNHEGRMQKRIDFLGPWIRNTAGKVVSQAALRVAVSVHESYLDAAFDQITQTSGSFDTYLTDVLGVNSNRRAQIEARILR